MGKKREVLNLKICGYSVDQVAFFTDNIEHSVGEYRKSGHDSWVVDTVIALSLMTKKKFAVELAFNYTFLPCEFELISILRGKTVQIPSDTGVKHGLSHVGFHVDDIHEAKSKFLGQGYHLLDDIATLSHSGTSNRYRYSFFDTRKDFGFVSKLIRRVDDE